MPEAPARTNGYAPTSPYNNGNAGTSARAGTLAANLVQGQWFADVATRAILPLFTVDADRPFALVFWSRDPDGTQHNQGDSLGTLVPGINGATSRQGVQNADRALAQLLAWLDAHPDVKATTDVFVTSDHGFATISRREIDRMGHAHRQRGGEPRLRRRHRRDRHAEGHAAPGLPRHRSLARSAAAALRSGSAQRQDARPVPPRPPDVRHLGASRVRATD